MKHKHFIVVMGLLLSGCWDETEQFISATNQCRHDMLRGCRECLDSNGEVVINYAASEFYALCMDRKGYTMGVAEAQRCLQSPSLSCFGAGEKLSWFWEKYTSRVSESFEAIKQQN